MEKIVEHKMETESSFRLTFKQARAANAAQYNFAQQCSRAPENVPITRARISQSAFGAYCSWLKVWDLAL